ncbi:MarR family winged helix-turn-helix transcriptional regulator [Amphibiibacter pelophylacis]|uniref:MarR family transcriptional regulator n=1 Tax=Amphibiibacter pelophylacis TaxID=1799477 RepID=A0ACC6P0X1_9BURK
MNWPDPPDTSASPNPLALDGQLCFALYAAHLGMNRVYRQALAGLDLTYPQYLVMLVLWEGDGLRVSDICQRLMLDTATLTPLLKRLEVRGLLTRQRATHDERQVLVTLTDSGRSLRQQALDVPGCIHAALQCSPQDLAALRDPLIALRQRLDAQ